MLTARYLKNKVPSIKFDVSITVGGDKKKNMSFEKVTIETKLWEKLAKADKNKDGRYTIEELTKALDDMGAYFPEWRASRCFSKVDANNDGYISGDEIGHLIDYLLECGYGK